METNCTITEAKEKRTQAGLVFQNDKGTYLRTLGERDALGFLAEVLDEQGNVLFVAHQGDWHQVSTTVPSKKKGNGVGKLSSDPEVAALQKQVSEAKKAEALKGKKAELMAKLQGELEALQAKKANG